MIPLDDAQAQDCDTKYNRDMTFLRVGALMIIKATLNDLTSCDPNRRMIGMLSIMSGELDTPFAVAGKIAGRTAREMRRRLEERAIEYSKEERHTMTQRRLLRMNPAIGQPYIGPDKNGAQVEGIIERGAAYAAGSVPTEYAVRPYGGLQCAFVTAAQIAKHVDGLELVASMESKD